MNTASSVEEIIFRMHSNVASTLSSCSSLTELISTDGYEDRQVTEANAFLLLAAKPQTCHHSTQLNRKLLRLIS